MQHIGLDSGTKLPYSVSVMKAGDVIKVIRRSKDIGPGLLAAMARQLGLKKSDLEG